MDAPRSLPQPASYSDGIPAPQISAAHPPPSTTTWGWRQACEMPGEHDLSQCVTHKKNNDLPACLWGTKRPQNVEASEWSQVNCRMRATVAAKRGGRKVAGSSEQDDPRVRPLRRAKRLVRYRRSPTTAHPFAEVRREPSTPRSHHYRRRSTRVNHRRRRLILNAFLRASWQTTQYYWIQTCPVQSNLQYKMVGHFRSRGLCVCSSIHP